MDTVTNLRRENSDYSDFIDEIERAAAHLAEVIRLEKSGTRDGDGFWHGSDPVAPALSDLCNLYDQLEKYWSEWMKEYRGCDCALVGGELVPF